MSLWLRLRAWEVHTKACWEDPSFQLTGPDGTSYHWLQHIGTTELVGDINLLRTAIGARKLSFHTVSYGTQVGGLYATMFPNHVDKRVVAYRPATPDGFKWSWELAHAKEKAWNRIAMVCDMMPDKGHSGQGQPGQLQPILSHQRTFPRQRPEGPGTLRGACA